MKYNKKIAYKIFMFGLTSDTPLPLGQGVRKINHTKQITHGQFWKKKKE